MPYLFISAAHKSSGKTVLSIGLCGALRARGLSLQPFKKGPDYIDPLWLSAAAKRSCLNLDFHTMGTQEIRDRFAQRMMGCDLGLIEGNKGLFDGMDLAGSDSNAALAILLGAPVVLVVDTTGMTRGVAPLIQGYRSFDKRVRIAGVILNKVGGTRHEGKLRAVIEHYTDLPVLGAVHRDKALEIHERHLGLIPSNEERQAEEKIATLARAVAAQVDLDRMLAVAATAPPVPVVQAAPIVKAPGDVRIGVAMDRAFGFYYPDDLESLQAEGAELVPFDTLSDASLPDVDGLLIGGGFPETVMRDLEHNAGLRRQIREFVEMGGPVYAECGGLMYLARGISWHGEHREMVGVIPAEVVMYERPQGRGYVKLEETGMSPWPELAADLRKSPIHGHEFHYSSLKNLSPESVFAYRVLRGAGIDGEHDGFVYKNLLACYAHMRDVGSNGWTRRFCTQVRRCAGRSRTTEC